MTAKRVDANQQEIVDALRKIPGVTVRDTHTVGKGFPDIAVGYWGQTVLMEIKNEKGKLTKDEQEFFDTWMGACYVVRTIDEAMEVLKILQVSFRLINR